VELDQVKDKAAQAQATEERLQALSLKGQIKDGEISELQRNLNFLSGRADTQAQEAIDALQVLREENERLKQEINEAPKTDPAQVEVMAQEKETLQQQIAENVSRIKELEGQLAGQAAAQEAVGKSQALINRLSDENKKLKEGVVQITGKIKAVQGEFHRALQEGGPAGQDIAEKERQLAQAQESIQNLQAQIKTLTAQIDDNHTKMKTLEGEMSAAAADGAPSAAAPDSAGWQQERIQMQQVLEQLKQQNTLLSQKEKKLQQELIKSRTKSVGLEKICEQYKEQLEKQ